VAVLAVAVLAVVGLVLAAAGMAAAVEQLLQSIELVSSSSNSRAHGQLWAADLMCMLCIILCE
jgi:hypothetical protein